MEIDGKKSKKVNKKREILSQFLRYLENSCDVWNDSVHKIESYFEQKIISNMASIDICYSFRWYDTNY